jgi:hypothetical protein
MHSRNIEAAGRNIRCKEDGRLFLAEIIENCNALRQLLFSKELHQRRARPHAPEAFVQKTDLWKDEAGAVFANISGVHVRGGGCDPVALLRSDGAVAILSAFVCLKQTYLFTTGHKDQHFALGMCAKKRKKDVELLIEINNHVGLNKL